MELGKMLEHVTTSEQSDEILVDRLLAEELASNIKQREGKTKLSKPELNDQLDGLLMKMTAVHALTIALPESVEFKKFVHALNPNYLIQLF